MSKLIILVGISASGKSTFAEQMLASKDESFIRVSRDEYRYMWKNSGVVSEKLEGLISKRVMQDIGYFLRNKMNVIYDATNLTARYLNEFVEAFNCDAEIEFVVFDVDVDECIRRDDLRKRTVGESVIRNQFQKFETLKKNYDFSTLPKKKRKYQVQSVDPKKADCVCVDIDGTIADLGDRDPYATQGVLNDKVNKSVLSVMQSMKRDNPYLDIILVSGREDKVNKETIQWLKTNKVPYDELYMRRTGDRRKDAQIKKEIYNEHILPYYNVLFVIDDRQQVVDQLRSMGLTVFQVAEGNF